MWPIEFTIGFSQHGFPYLSMYDVIYAACAVIHVDIVGGKGSVVYPTTACLLTALVNTS